MKYILKQKVDEVIFNLVQDVFNNDVLRYNVVEEVNGANTAYELRRYAIVDMSRLPSKEYYEQRICDDNYNDKGVVDHYETLERVDYEIVVSPVTGLVNTYSVGYTGTKSRHEVVRSKMEDFCFQNSKYGYKDKVMS